MQDTSTKYILRTVKNIGIYILKKIKMIICYFIIVETH